MVMSIVAKRQSVPISTTPRSWRDNTGIDATGPTRCCEATPEIAATLAIPAGVIDPASRGGKQGGGDGQANDEQTPRQRRRVAHVVVDKRLFVEVHHVEQRRVVRPGGVLIKNVRGQEILECGDRGQDQVVED